MGVRPHSICRARGRGMQGDYGDTLEQNIRMWVEVGYLLYLRGRGRILRDYSN